ncbi:MAG: LysR family transcriptional regulator [Chloroflexi bacterium]|nr:MAG: LysR family transcriptional regulator [Chloroflexota bacterium]
MSRAAESLYLTQSAVSQQVANLEARLGLRLLERAGRRVRLTEAGSTIAAAAETAILAAEAVSEAARRLGTLESGSLLIGASPTAAANHLPALLAGFIALHPQVRIKVVTENTPRLAALVAGGTLDCAVIEGATGHEELVERLLQEDEVIVVVAAGHPLAGMARVGPAELAQHRYVGREPGAILEDLAEEILGDRYEATQKIELGHLDAVRAAVLAGLGYAVLPRISIAGALADGRLVELPIPVRRRWISAIRRRSTAGATLEEFWRLLPPAPLIKA